MKLPGNIRVRCEPELRKELLRGGSVKGTLFLNEIKNIPSVVDVWLIKDKEKKFDMMVEIEVNNYEEGKTLEQEIKKMSGIEDAVVRVAVEVEA